ncbi:hypothetical protein SprV_0200824200 [Sparganum proliferum]
MRTGRDRVHIGGGVVDNIGGGAGVIVGGVVVVVGGSGGGGGGGGGESDAVSITCESTQVILPTIAPISLPTSSVRINMSANCFGLRWHPLLLFCLFCFIVLLNAATPQAASMERISSDELEEEEEEEDIFKTGEEEVEGVQANAVEGEAVEEPGRPTNPLMPAGWWRRFRERVKRFLRGRGCRAGRCRQPTQHVNIVRIPF